MTHVAIRTSGAHETYSNDQQLETRLKAQLKELAGTRREAYAQEQYDVIFADPKPGHAPLSKDDRTKLMEHLVDTFDKLISETQRYADPRKVIDAACAKLRAKADDRTAVTIEKALRRYDRNMKRAGWVSNKIPPNRRRVMIAERKRDALLLCLKMLHNPDFEPDSASRGK